VTEDVESVPKLVAKENRWSRAGRVDREDFHHAQPRAIVRIDADTRPRPAPMFNSSEPALGFPPHAPASTTTPSEAARSIRTETSLCIGRAHPKAFRTASFALDRSALDRSVDSPAVSGLP
jgi:hypothetical protein